MFATCPTFSLKCTSWTCALLIGFLYVHFAPSLISTASIPMIFIIGSGAATGMAIIFVVVIGCSIRYSRMRSTQPTRMKNSNVKQQPRK